MSARLAVGFEHPDQRQRAADLAQRLDLPILPPGEAHELYLVFTPERLELRQSGPGAPGPVFTDFTAGRMGYRSLRASKLNEPLGRALGLRKKTDPAVVDATAGLGRDAFILACLGCTVTLLERDPVVAALLADGMERASRTSAIAPVIERMQLIVADAREWLDQHRCERVYLDPMYPQREKSALVKKEMRMLQSLLGDTGTGQGLLESARASASERVVVKRPVHAPALDGVQADYTVPGSSTRFDVYLARPA